VENDNRKILTLSFLIAAVLVFFVVGMLIDTASSMSGTLARVFGNDLVRAGVQVSLGALTFGLLQFKKDWVHFFDEVIVELKKIVWPSRKDTVAMTIVVCMMVVISGIIFAVFDMFSTYVITSLPQFMGSILN
jgi:preprotein translocase subunit SecE